MATKRNEAHRPVRPVRRADDGLGGDEPGEGLVVTPQVPLGEWDKTVLLAYEREMLGLYVSDHPLFGVEHVLAAAADCSIAVADRLRGPRRRLASSRSAG